MSEKFVNGENLKKALEAVKGYVDNKSLSVQSLTDDEIDEIWNTAPADDGTIITTAELENGVLTIY